MGCSPVELGFNLEKIVCGWNLGVLEPPEKRAVDWKTFGSFLGHFLMTSPFSTNLSKQDFQKVLKREFQLFHLKDYEK